MMRRLIQRSGAAEGKEQLRADSRRSKPVMGRPVMVWPAAGTRTIGPGADEFDDRVRLPGLQGFRDGQAG